MLQARYSIEAGTPLHSAAKWGNTDVVEVLLAHGANKNAKDEVSDMNSAR